MENLVTKDEAAAQLMLDTDAHGPWLDIWIPAITNAIALWLKDEWRLYVLALDTAGEPIILSSGDPLLEIDTSGNPIAKPVVKAAALVELAQQFRFRDGDQAPAVPSHWGHGYVLGAGATSLLSALRKSTLA